MIKKFSFVSIAILGFIMGAIFSYNYFALRNLWDWESGSLEQLDTQMKDDRSMRLAIIILTEKGQYEISRIDKEKYKLNLQILQKVAL